MAFICCAWVAKSSANILFRADSHWPAPSLIASAIPVWSSVAEALVITDEPSGMRASTAWRAASRSPTTSTLNPCSSSATTVACSAGSSGSVVKRSGMAVVLTAGPPLRSSSAPEATGHRGKRPPPDSGDIARQQPRPPGKDGRPGGGIAHAAAGSETIVPATARPGAFHRHAYQRELSSGHANHHDQVTPPNLPGGKPGSARHPSRNVSSRLTWARPPGVLPREFRPKGDPP